MSSDEDARNTGHPPGPNPVLASLFDEEYLARRARTTLAGSDQARLVVADGGPRVCGEYQVTVRDDGGEPILLVPCGGVLQQVARRRCHAALMLGATSPDGVGVTLVGRLAEQPEAATGLIAPAAICLGCEPVTGLPCPGWTAVALTVQRVHTSCPRVEVRVQTRPRREIPLELYAMAEPDELAAGIPWIQRHLNGSHPEQVRAIAARCARLPLSGDRCRGEPAERSGAAIVVGRRGRCQPDPDLLPDAGAHRAGARRADPWLPRSGQCLSAGRSTRW